MFITSGPGCSVIIGHKVKLIVSSHNIILSKQPVQVYTNQNLHIFKAGNKRFINEIRPNWLDKLREHVISGINMENLYKFVFVLSVKNFICQKYVVF